MNIRKEIEALESRIAAGDPKDAVKEAIKLLDYLPNGVASWVEAFGGDKTKAKKHGETCKQIVQQLGGILKDMANSMSYMVVGLEGGTKEFDSKDELVKYLKSKGINETGSEGGSHLRPELQGQPVFEKLHGPMHGGGGVVRYETPEMYDRLSR